MAEASRSGIVRVSLGVVDGGYILQTHFFTLALEGPSSSSLSAMSFKTATETSSRPFVAISKSA